MTTNISAIIPLLPQALKEQVPHYEETLRPDLYAAVGISLPLAYICVGLRVYGRRLQGQNLWWDDYTSIIALVFASASVATFLILVYLALGRHEIVLVLERSEQIVTSLRVLIAMDALYFPAVCFPKLSILLQYRRLFPAKRFKFVMIAVGVATIIYGIIGMIVVTVLCMPIKVPTLDRPIDHPLACANFKEMILVAHSFNAVFDFVILFLPIPYLWRLNTTIRRKLQLTGVFLLGSFVVAISILRTWYFTQLHFEDFTWTGSLGGMWSEVEVCLSIVAGCLPAMMPIFRGKGFGRKQPIYKPTKHFNLVTFGSGGKKIIPNDISVVMPTAVTATTYNGDYTELVDQVGQENQARYYQGGDRW